MFLLQFPKSLSYHLSTDNQYYLLGEDWWSLVRLPCPLIRPPFRIARRWTLSLKILNFPVWHLCWCVRNAGRLIHDLSFSLLVVVGSALHKPHVKTLLMLIAGSVSSTARLSENKARAWLSFNIVFRWPLVAILSTEDNLKVKPAPFKREFGAPRSIQWRLDHNCRVTYQRFRIQCNKPIPQSRTVSLVTASITCSERTSSLVSSLWSNVSSGVKKEWCFKINHFRCELSLSEPGKCNDMFTDGSLLLWEDFTFNIACCIWQFSKVILQVAIFKHLFTRFKRTVEL